MNKASLRFYFRSAKQADNKFDILKDKLTLTNSFVADVALKLNLLSKRDIRNEIVDRNFNLRVHENVDCVYFYIDKIEKIFNVKGMLPKNIRNNDQQTVYRDAVGHGLIGSIRQIGEAVLIDACNNLALELAPNLYRLEALTVESDVSRLPQTNTVRIVKYVCNIPQNWKYNKTIDGYVISNDRLHLQNLFTDKRVIHQTAGVLRDLLTEEYANLLFGLNWKTEFMRMGVEVKEFKYYRNPFRITLHSRGGVVTTIHKDSDMPKPPEGEKIDVIVGEDSSKKRGRKWEL